MNPFETCSWCTCEVLDRALRQIPDGARLCPDCYREWLESK